MLFFKKKNVCHTYFDLFRFQDYNDDIRQEQMWEMQILSTQGREGSQTAEAPSSPELCSDPANSPTAATTAVSIEGQDSTPRPTPSPPNPATLKTQGTVLQTVTSTLGENQHEPRTRDRHLYMFIPIIK